MVGHQVPFVDPAFLAPGKLTLARRPILTEPLRASGGSDVWAGMIGTGSA